jgi:hypothetical protein
VPKIEFFYYADCPSHERALELLRQGMAEEHVNAPIEIFEVTSDEEAHRYNFFGSPTIRVNGVDIAPLLDDLPEPALTCRAYRRANGSISPLPPRELITAALHPYSEISEATTSFLSK